MESGVRGFSNKLLMHQKLNKSAQGTSENSDVKTT